MECAMGGRVENKTRGVRQGIFARWLRVVAVVLGFGGAVLPAHGELPSTELISVRAADEAAGLSRSAVGAASADGRFVAFSSLAMGAVDFPNIYVRDRDGAVTERVSLALDGARTNGASQNARVSADGRYVTFESWASNLVHGDTNGLKDVFVHDRVTRRTERISVGGDGTQANSPTNGGSVSADGRFVAFDTIATNLLPNAVDGRNHVYVKDRWTHALELIDVGSSGSPAEVGGFHPSMSADGRYVAFVSSSTLVTGDANAQYDIYVRDRLAQTTERISVDSAGREADRYSEEPFISPDGRYVVFKSHASNLVPGDTNGQPDIFLHDRVTATTERVSVGSTGSQANGSSEWGSISADGRRIAFMSSASNLVTGDSNSKSDIFVRDRQGAWTVRASVASAGTQSYGAAAEPAITSDGRFVVFNSDATDLVPNAVNARNNVFLRVLDGAPPVARFTIKPFDLEFGAQTVWTWRTLSFWLRNKGTAPLAIRSIDLQGPNRDMFSLRHGCGAFVPVASTCRIRVIFRPTAAGNQSVAVRVVAGDDEVRLRQVTGVGLAGAP
jgi:Tol biopolymer transport system component